MSGAQFTKGPWRTGPAHVVAQQTTDDRGRRVTRFVAEAVLSVPFVEGEREANARLMAAAPELYEALDHLRSYGCPICSGDCASANPPVAACPIRQASIALAKARAGA